MVSIDKARAFVFQNGQLWERALFSYLFDGGSLAHVHRCLLAYKNEDGGFGHGLEPDIKCPDSNPLALEFLLSVVRDTRLPVGDILDGTPEWVERNRNEDGSLKNPDNLHQYPFAPWWSGGGQTIPDAIVGNLRRVGLSTPSLEQSTAKWAAEHLTVEKIVANDWLFMAYHAHDYYLTMDDSEEVRPYKEAAIRNIIKCTEQAPEKSKFVLLHFASRPDNEVSRALPPELLQSVLDHVEQSQREDGGWDDEHGLPYWQPYFTTMVLWALKNHNRL
ncbi:MAG TPA: hypothetical protein VFV52_18660 [Bacilli bacterium]|nr:hypothetical protein [Bacilli bacterium]